MQKKRGTRLEKDYLGSKKIPKEAYYGIETQRALENFKVSGLHFPKKLIYSIAMIKKAAVLAHLKAREIDSKKAHAIAEAADDVISGQLDSQFNLDVFQAGAGTSEHMNVNEVIANKALEYLGKKKGSYSIINPYNHVNLGQSTNDVFHSAIHISSFLEIKRELLPALENLQKALEKKAKLWNKVIKSGRTHLRDALPITLGQEFGAYASMIEKAIKNIKYQSTSLFEINLGGTAIGSGVNASKAYQAFIFKELQKITKYHFRQSRNLFEGTSSLNAIVQVSSSLKALAIDLIKIADDIRLISSGPSSGFNEITLPAIQEGSSIMPGKVNPSIAEMVDMAAFQVISNDTNITLCAQSGQLELNVMMPSSAYSLLMSIEILTRSTEIFADKCIKGISANKEKCKEYLEKNPIIVTSLTPYLGYEKSAQIAKKAYKEGKSVREIVLKEKLISPLQLDKLLSLKNLINKK